MEEERARPEEVRRRYMEKEEGGKIEEQEAKEKEETQQEGRLSLPTLHRRMRR